MAQDNSPKFRSMRKFQRKAKTRARHPRILIVTEGKKTEPNYFREILSYYRLPSVNIRNSKLGTTPLQVVRYAEKLCKEGELPNHIRPKSFDQVYAVFDRDDHKNFDEALNLAKSLNGKLKNDENKPVIFQAIPSIPNFELWLLLHYEDVLAPLHRKEVLRKLKKYIHDYEKSKKIFLTTTHANI